MNNNFINPRVFAKNIPFGSTVSIYGEMWICISFVTIYDGEYELERILLYSLEQGSTLQTFVHPTHQFSQLSDGTYSDCEEFPF